MPEVLPQFTVYDIPMQEVYSDAAFNCRGTIAPIDVLDLARSIKETGLQQPIVVQPYNNPARPQCKYRIVAGHRRHMAFVINKATKIPGYVRNDLDELNARVFNLTENLKRQELNILQEANALLPFKRAGWTQELIVAKTGTSRGWVQVRLMLLDLPDEIQKEAAAGLLTQEHIRQLYTMPTNEKRFEAVKLIKDRKDRGEKASLEKLKPVRPHEKKLRSEVEIFALQDYIQEQVGNSILTRILGWAGGVVTPYELHRDLVEYYRTQGETYRIPKEILEKL